MRRAAVGAADVGAATIGTEPGRLVLLAPMARHLLLALLCGCATAPKDTGHHAHAHTATITVTATGLQPGATVVVPTFATVVWQNRTGAPLEVAVDGAGCNDCDTVLGFAAAGQGARALAIAPGAVATLCFHDAGSFGFVARGDAGEWRGAIEVGGGR